jgi:hypothetical protein
MLAIIHIGMPEEQVMAYFYRMWEKWQMENTGMCRTLENTK